MSFDIEQSVAAIALEDTGAVVEILDENDEPALAADGSPVTITVAGMNSQRYRKAEIWQRKAMRAAGGNMKPEAQLTMQTEFIARCCIGWNGFTNRGEVLPFSIENTTDAFTKLPFLQKQVERAMSDRARFFGKSSNS